ncbi:MAG: DUF2341 domain-containing protein, partial [Acidiferrobacterales bacterium]
MKGFTTRFGTRMLAGIVGIGLLLFTISADAAWYGSGWQNRKTITLDGSKIVGTVSNYPIPIVLTDADLSVAQNDGGDLLFTDSDGVTKLDHEIETWTKTSGTLVAWVRIPSMTAGTNKTIYLYYRNPSVANQWNPTGVWDTSYEGVYHLHNNSFADSTSNANNASNSGTTNTTGKLAGGRDIPNTNPLSSVNHINSNIPSTAFTNTVLEAWFKSDNPTLGGSNNIAQRVITDKRTANSSRIAFGIDNGFFSIGYKPNSAAGFTSTASTSAITAGTWYHGAVTYDGTTLRGFLNGTEVLTITADVIAPSADPILIGLQSTTSGSIRSFDGQVDEVRISNNFRSTNYLQTVYATTSDPAAVISNTGVQEIYPPVATSITSEISPNDVYTSSTGNQFEYASQVVINTAQFDSGFDRININIPSTFGAATLTSVTVNGTPVAASGAMNGSVFEVTLTTPVTANGTQTVKVNFTADGPTATDTAGVNFTASFDDTSNTAAAMDATEGNGDGDASDNNSWKVTTTAFTPWYNANWKYRKETVLDGSKFCATVSSFPVLVKLTGDTDLQANARADGFDILFTAADGVTKLPHEIESFNKATGDLIAWVKVDITSGTSQSIYMYYGNSGAADQQDKANLWGTNYRGVWHLNDATGAANPDSSGNGNNGTPISDGALPFATTGQISGALDFNTSATRSMVAIPASPSLDMSLYSNWTISAWVKPTSYVGMKWPAIFGHGKGVYMGLSVKEGSPNGRVELWVNNVNVQHGTNPANFNSWNHVAIVRDPVTTRVYLNGVLDGSFASDTVNFSGQVSSIGSSDVDNVGENDFRGLIDEVRVSNISRSPAWMQASVCTVGGVVGSTTPVQNPAVSAAVSEISPNTVTAGSTGNAFTYDVLPTIGSNDTGVNQLAITAPAGYANLAVTGVSVGGSALTAGASCPSVGAGEYCATVSGQTMTMSLGSKITTSLTNIKVNFTADAPASAGTADFTATVDDTATPVSAQSTVAGNADGVANANSITVATTASVALTGTVTNAVESNIVTGGSTIVLTLTGDTWAAAGAAFDAERQNIINGLTSAGAEANGWNNLVKSALAVTDVVRTSNTVVTITLPAVAGYDITADETITATVPASALALSSAAAVASPTFSIKAVSVALTGTVTNAVESNIVTGGSTIVLTLTGDTWAAAGAAFDAERQNIINGLTSAGAEANGWNNLVKSALAVTDVVRTSNTVVTITLPAVAGYDITADETITATVPASALALSSAAAVASPTFSIKTTAVASIAATTNANETGPVNGQFTVSLSNAVSSATTVNYTVLGTSTATAGGTDYTTLSGSVAIAAGVSTATIDVTGINDDAIVEGTETVVVQITSTNNALVTIGATDTATVNILDNDTATASIAATTNANETGPVNGQFTVTLTAAPAVATTVSYNVLGTSTATNGGTDYATL